MMCTFFVASMLSPGEDVSPLPHDTLGSGLSAFREDPPVPTGMTPVGFLPTTSSNDCKILIWAGSAPRSHTRTHMHFLCAGAILGPFQGQQLTPSPIFYPPLTAEETEEGRTTPASQGAVVGGEVLLGQVGWCGFQKGELAKEGGHQGACISQRGGIGSGTPNQSLFGINLVTWGYLFFF